jgi:hypothetical protein
MTHRDLADDLEHDPFLDEPPSKPKRSAQTERDKFKSDMLHMVMEIFPGARWTTRDEYKRASAQRDRKWRKKRG